jgi:hypothetical protein
MRNQLFLAGLTLAAVLPVQAFAQETCEQRASNRAAGTALGAIAGAVIGSQLAGRGDRTAGTVVGGVAGGVIGNQLAKGPHDCAHAYGWYDDYGRWHATGVSQAEAVGYYDRNGQWIDGPPPNYQYAQAPEYGRDRTRGDEGTRGGDRRYYDRSWNGYPDFQNREQRLGQLIESGVANGAIDPGNGRDLMRRLGDIRIEEAREYRNHGPALPYDDRDRINSELRDLDRSIDQARGAG